MISDFKISTFAVATMCSLVGSISGAFALECSVRTEARDDPWVSVNPDKGKPYWPSCLSAKTLLQDAQKDGSNCIPDSKFSSKWRCLFLDTDARLCPSSNPELEPYQMTVVLNTDNVALDCQGRMINATGGQNSTATGNTRPAIRAPYETSISGVTIRNCSLDSEKVAAVDLHRYFRADEPCLRSPTVEECYESGYPEDCVDWDLRVDPFGPECANAQDAMLGHNRITLEDIYIDDPKASGVYIGQGGTQILLHRVYIKGGSVGVYVERSSGVSIYDSVISYARKDGGLRIDSSERVHVVNTQFFRNLQLLLPWGEEKYASVDLEFYRNAGEKGTKQDGSSLGESCPAEREMGANNNSIRSNVFGGLVRVASRDGREFHEEGYVNWADNFKDEANGNVFTNNTFTGASYQNGQYRRVEYIGDFPYGLDLLIAPGLELLNNGEVIVHGNQFYSAAKLMIGPYDGIGLNNDYEPPGWVAENIADENTLQLRGETTGVNLEIHGNRAQDNSCLNMLGLNECRSEPTISLHQWVISRGLMAAMF